MRSNKLDPLTFIEVVNTPLSTLGIDNLICCVITPNDRKYVFTLLCVHFVLLIANAYFDIRDESKFVLFIFFVLSHCYYLLIKEHRNILVPDKKDNQFSLLSYLWWVKRFFIIKFYCTASLAKGQENCFVTLYHYWHIIVLNHASDRGMSLVHGPLISDTATNVSDYL